MSKIKCVLIVFTMLLTTSLYSRENAKRNTEREKRTHEEIDRVIDEALRADY